MTMPTEFKLSPERELDRICSMPETVKISSVSKCTWKREHADKIIHLSKRRIGVRLRDALMLRDEK